MNKAIVYGIPNCDTVKKSLLWLQNNKVAFDFFNYKKSTITQQKLNEWCKLLGWENVLNKKSATWRGLSDEEQSSITNQTNAIAIMLNNTSIIKRPIIEIKNLMIVGYNEQEYEKVFLKK